MLGRRIAALAALLVAAALPAPAAAAGPEATRTALERQMRWAGGASGALVVDLDSDEEIYATRPDLALVPASVEKLFTTAAALLRFGPDATLQTSALGLPAPGVASEPAIDPVTGLLDGDIYLQGAGDPALDQADLEALATQLVDLGLVEVSGRVFGDESLFDSLRGPPSSGGRISRYVGPLSALSFNRGRTGLRAPYYQAHPPEWAARAFARALRRAGVKVSARARAGVAPPEAVALASVPSPKMGALVRAANVPSDNFIAEMLLKVLGARFGAGGTTTGGAGVVRATMATLGLRPRVADGSGLSRSNRTTARQVVRLLSAMAGNASFPAFRGSLAVAGRTGTLSPRMRRSPARDRCRGKTGTLRSVSALAGYCQTRGGRLVAYAILMNGVSPFGARALQDRMLGVIARYERDW